MTTEQLADAREMYMAHTMFRREFGLLPDLISGVADGDVARARLVADHAGLVDSVLQHHHRAEDEHLWPRLHVRGGAPASVLVSEMEAQHEQIHATGDQLLSGLVTWRDTASARQGDTLATLAGRLAALLREHLSLEEEKVVPLIEQYITAAEWHQMLENAGMDFTPEQLVLLFGMMMYEGEPAALSMALENMPPEVAAMLRVEAPAAYARHSAELYGTPTPARSGSPAVRAVI